MIVSTIFLDRDGVIVVPEFRDRRSFAPKRLEDFRFYPEAAASLQRLKGAGFILAIARSPASDAGWSLGMGTSLVPKSSSAA